MTNVCSVPLEESPCRKREIIHSNIYRILPKVNQVVYTLDTIGMPNVMTLAQAVIQIFCSQGPLWVKCLRLKRGIIQSNFNRILWNVNQVINHVSKLYAWYHDPSSSDSPDILFIRLLFHTKRQSRKREIIQSNICRILPKVNQVIYKLDTICTPNTTTLAQAVLQIFCSHGPLWVKCRSLKRGIIQSNFDRILWKVNQVFYIMYPNSMSDIMILSCSINILFTWLLFHTKQQSRKREIIQSNIYRFLLKVNQVIYTLDTFCIPHIMTLAQAILQIFWTQGPLWV